MLNKTKKIKDDLKLEDDDLEKIIKLINILENKKLG